MLAGTPDLVMPAAAWALLPVLLISHAAGEAMGYWNLVGGIEAQYEHFELHRLECLRSDERNLMTGLQTADYFNASAMKAATSRRSAASSSTSMYIMWPAW